MACWHTTCLVGVKGQARVFGNSNTFILMLEVSLFWSPDPALFAVNSCSSFLLGLQTSSLLSTSFWVSLSGFLLTVSLNSLTMVKSLLAQVDISFRLLLTPPQWVICALILPVSWAEISAGGKNNV